MRPRISERWAPRYWLETRSPGSGPPGLKGYLHLGDFVFDFQFLFLEIRDQSFVGMGVVHFLVDPFFQFCMPRLESIFPVFSVHRSLHLSLIRQNRIPAIERLQNISCQPTANSSISALRRETRRSGRQEACGIWMLEEAELRRRLAEAEQEHVDLDAMIDRVAEAGAYDQIQMQRLKKRKLRLKDEITSLRSRLIPDDIA